MWILLLALSLISPDGTPASVETLDGQAFAGNIVAIDNGAIEFGGEQGRKTIRLDKLLSIMVNEKGLESDYAISRAKQNGVVCVELTDGSLVRGSKFTVIDETAAFELLLPKRLQNKVEVSIGAINAVRLQAESEQTAAEWKRIRELQSADGPESRVGDLLVVKKGDLLDYHKGVLGNVSDVKVAFNLDGDVLPVPRRKVFGLIYHGSAGGDLPEAAAFAPLCRLDAADGSRWMLRDMWLRDGVLFFETPVGIKLSLPMSAVRALDFSGGKVVYLDELTPVSSEWTPYFGGEESSAARRSLFGPRTGRDTSGGPMRISGKTFSRGVSLHSRTELVYRLPDGFRRFRATAGIDDRARPRGHVRLTISGGGRDLLDAELSGTDRPLDVDVDISGLQTLTILVDYGDDLDVADHLDLGDARIVK